MITRLFVLTVFLSALVGQTSSALASDLAESSMCSRYFPIYEAKFHMPSNMLRAVAVTESGKWVKQLEKNVAWPWTINVEGQGYQFESKAQAIRAVKHHIAEGKRSIDIGCMQVNLKYHPDAFRNLEQAFEPRYNVAYSANFLSDKYKQKGSWEYAIRNYHSANPVHSDKYIERVYQTWRKEDRGISVASLETRRPASYISVKSGSIAAGEVEAVDVSAITRSVMERFVE